jgi:hypothetical protein
MIDEASRRDRVREAERAAALVTNDVVAAANEIIKQGLRALTRTNHPDAGGSVDAMRAVNNGAELLRATLNYIAERGERSTRGWMRSL